MLLMDTVLIMNSAARRMEDKLLIVIMIINLSNLVRQI
jgi:hypothetical protein